ncbi:MULTISPECIES: hypothetical protein [unclassified Rhizobium]|uniref:hypothetical protein n=1 Tax=unclassified Rhizobium TaxID=2613769 RepID=UPI000EA8F646|nr:MULTISPECIES: hypothetical protein [unclassified Rhizobium]AYG65411.1 hypothetical protein CCGE531_04960 [Rhizobium sp. CCGE531]AYG71894.1 hypothetical protein CCGE532_04955 [Rhizobium sp. CCGE532]
MIEAEPTSIIWQSQKADKTKSFFSPLKKRRPMPSPAGHRYGKQRLIRTVDCDGAFTNWAS